MKDWDSKRDQVVPIAADILRALAGLTPPTGAIAALSQIPAGYRMRRWVAFINFLLESMSVELDAVVAKLSDPKLESLVEQTQRMAESSRSDEKLRLAARIVADVLCDTATDEDIETANILLGLIEPLEAYQIEVFAVLGSARTGTGAISGSEHTGGWTTTDLQDRLPHISKIIPVIVANLIASGLAGDRNASSTTWGGLGRQQLGLTEAGMWLHNYLQTLDTT